MQGKLLLGTQEKPVWYGAWKHKAVPVQYKAWSCYKSSCWWPKMTAKTLGKAWVSLSMKTFCPSTHICRYIHPYICNSIPIWLNTWPHATTIWVAGYYFCSFHRYFVTRLTEQIFLKRKLHQRGPTNGSMATKTVRVLSFVSAIGIFLNQIHSMCLWWSYS